MRWAYHVRCHRRTVPSGPLLYPERNQIADSKRWAVWDGPFRRRKRNQGYLYTNSLRHGENLPAVQGLVVGCRKHGGSLTALVDSGDIHCLMIGAAGVGKTANFLYPNIEYACASGMSFLTTDTKGDLFRNYAVHCKRILWVSDLSSGFAKSHPIRRWQYTNAGQPLYGRLPAEPRESGAEGESGEVR